MKTAPHKQGPRLPDPSKNRSTANLPAAITFFVTGRQRRAICAALERVASDRSAALLSVLGVCEKPDQANAG